MTDLNLTPGISYRDYVQDAVYGISPPLWFNILNHNATDSKELENIQTNRLREQAVIVSEEIGVGTNIYGFDMSLSFIPTAGVSPAGYDNLDIGSVGFFNISSKLPDLERDFPGTTVTTTVNIIVKDSTSAIVANETYNLDRIFRKSNNNSRYSLNNFLIPILKSGNVQHTDIVSVELHFETEIVPTGAAISNLSGYNFINIGRVWIGNYMPVCFDAPWSITLDNPSKINYSAGLDAHAIEQRRRRRGSFPIESIVQNDAMTSITDIESDYPFTSFSDMQLQCGKDYPLVVSHRRERNETYPDRIYPDPYVLFGLMSKDMSLQHVSGPLYQTQIDVVELI